MRQLLYFAIAFLIAPLAAAGAKPEVSIAEFSGHDDEQTEAFDVKGPWLLEYEVDSEFPDLATTTIQTEDATDHTIGTVAGFRGTGHGLKLFRKGGRYRLNITGETSDWRIEILEISDAWAKRLERSTATARFEHPHPSELQREVASDSFSHWHADSDQSMILTGTGPTNFRVSFGGGGCPGLTKTKMLSFMTPDKGPLYVYDSVLLDNGKRCYFDKEIWIAR